MTTQASRLYDKNLDTPAEEVDDVVTTGLTEQPQQSQLTTLSETELTPSHDNTPTAPTSRRLTPKAAGKPTHPGEALREAREKQNLSLNHIAERLYLNPSVISALESDSYEELPAPTFVRGYIRNYAKLIDIEYEPLLQAYNQLTRSAEVSPQIVPQRPPKHAANMHAETWWLRWLPVFLIALLVFTVLWQFKPTGFSGEELPRSTDSLETLTNATENQETSLLPPNLNHDAGAYTPPGETEDDVILDEGDMADTNDDMPAVGNSTLNTTNTEGAATGTENGEVTTTPEEVSSSTLRIVYTRDSWTRVIDAADTRLFVGIKKKGDTLEIEGKPPFTVRFGVIQAASIEYQGNTFKAEDYPDRNGRTLTIGQPAL